MNDCTRGSPSRKRTLRRISAGALCLLVVACLPEDETAPPGVASFVFQGDPSAAEPVLLDDGWSVRVVRAFALLARSYQNGPLCDVYSESAFAPVVVDALRADVIDLGRVRGLGPCSSPLRPGGFGVTPRVGTSFSADDDAVLAAALEDANDFGNGLHVYVEAIGTRGDQSVTLAIALPATAIWLLCPRADGRSDYTLRSGETVPFRVSFAPQTLFLDGFGPTAQHRFGPIAEADTNGDGRVTRSELEAVRLTDLFRATGTYAELLAPSPGQPSLGYFDPSLFTWLTLVSVRSYASNGDACLLAATPSFEE